MPIYNGNSKAKSLYYGGTKIKEAYYGSTKVYNGLPLYFAYFANGRGGIQYDYVKVPIGCDRNQHNKIKTYRASNYNYATNSADLVDNGYVASDSYITEEFLKSGSSGQYYFPREASKDLYT